MTLTVSTGSGFDYGQVIVNQEGDGSSDDYAARNRIGRFAIEYSRRTWRGNGQPGAREKPNTPLTSGVWSLATPPGEQHVIAGIVDALIAGKQDALVEWNRTKT
jgi:hypothetical protein